MLSGYSNPLYLPSLPNRSVADALANLTVDATTEKAAFIVEVPKSGTITKVLFRFGTITLMDPLELGLETVGATTGDPSGTLYGGSDEAAFTPAATDDDTFRIVTLAVAATAVKGNQIAVQIDVPTYTDGNFTIQYLGSGISQQFPYCDAYVGAPAWAKATGCPILAFGYSDGSWEVPFGCFPATPVTRSYDSNDAIDEYANKFYMPVKAEVHGVWAVLDMDEGASFHLYDNSATPVELAATAVQDKDIRVDANVGLKFVQFATAVTIGPGYYYLSCKPSTTTAVVVQGYQFPTAALTVGEGTTDIEEIMKAVEFGTNCYEVGRTDAGGWTHFDISRRLKMGIVLGSF